MMYDGRRLLFQWDAGDLQVYFANRVWFIVANNLKDFASHPYDLPPS